MPSAWRIATEEESMASRVLRAKYFHNTSFWRAKGNCPKSAFWTSILNIKDQFTANCTIQIANGSSNIWNTPWCPFWDHIQNHLNTQDPNYSYPNTISDLWLPNSKTQNLSLISNLFGQANCDIVASIPISTTNHDDIIVWKQSPNGICSSKSPYKSLNSHLFYANPAINVSFLGITKNITLAAWRCKCIPPSAQTFAWRLLREAITTGQRGQVRSKHIDAHCK